MQRRICARASVATYVTRKFLQSRYPAPKARLVNHASNVEIRASQMAPCPRIYATAAREPLLVLVGSLEVGYKGVDTALHAMRLLVDRGWAPQLEIAGSGRYQGEYERLASKLGIADRVVFRGMLSREGVRSLLERGSLLVMPSRQEGLPRAMIEAMAAALPCVGSNVAGIPELLEPEDIVPPNDPKLLAAKLAEVLGDPARLCRMSGRNLEVAREYSKELLQARWDAWCGALRDVTAEWLKRDFPLSGVLADA
ncbi:MAG: glycosyltransferase family 4 protein [Planctomycetota bacterium]